jgi:hypothetical protein
MSAKKSDMHVSAAGVGVSEDNGSTQVDAAIYQPPLVISIEDLEAAAANCEAGGGFGKDTANPQCSTLGS